QETPSMCHCAPKRTHPIHWVRSALLGAAALAVVLTAAAVQRAQDDPPPAALKAGDDLPGPFRPWTFTGKYIETLRRRVLATITEKDDAAVKELKTKQAAAIVGMFHCPLSENGLNPTVLIFVKGTEPTDAQMQLLQKIDEMMPKHERVRAATA